MSWSDDEKSEEHCVRLSLWKCSFSSSKLILFTLSNDKTSLSSCRVYEKYVFLSCVIPFLCQKHLIVEKQVCCFLFKHSSSVYALPPHCYGGFRIFIWPSQSLPFSLCQAASSAACWAFTSEVAKVAVTLFCIHRSSSAVVPGAWLQQGTHLSDDLVGIKSCGALRVPVWHPYLITESHRVSLL